MRTITYQARLKKK